MPARKYTDEQRDRFFEALARGGTIRAAAAAADVHPDAGYRWVKRAGIGQSRRAPREYSREDKDRFFRLLAERGNVSAVARELGFVRVTCYKWAHQAGVFTGKSADAKRVGAGVRRHSVCTSQRQCAAGAKAPKGQGSRAP